MNTTEIIKELEKECEELNNTVAELMNKICRLKEEQENESYSYQPKEGERYVFVDDCDIISYANYHLDGKDTIDDNRTYSFNCFPHMIDLNECVIFETSESIIKYSQKLRFYNRLMQLKLMLCPSYKPDWDDRTENKYYIVHNRMSNNFEINYTIAIDNQLVYFTVEAADKACEILNNTFQWED